MTRLRKYFGDNPIRQIKVNILYRFPTAGVFKYSIVSYSYFCSVAEFFKELLTTAKGGFHDMFKRTYGIIYEQNSFVFTDLFEELEHYYAKGKVDLTDTMESFFNTLYQKMFTVINSHYRFDDK